jgi:hypothetical protein
LEKTLDGAQFRGMTPYLMYSVRVFQILAQSQDYAQVLAADQRAVPLLLDAVRMERQEMRFALELDAEGRRLALDALFSVAQFGLWPKSLDQELILLGNDELPILMEDHDAAIRSSAARFWAKLNCRHMLLLFLIGKRLENRGCLQTIVWRENILSCLFPFLSVG